MLKITSELAMPIVNQLMIFLNSNINIMDENGVIVASGDLNRLYQKHDGAVQVISTKEELIITDEDNKRFSGSKPGVNLPIEFNHEVVGVVGLTGNPKEVYKFAKIIKMTVEVLLQQIFITNQVQYQQKAMEGFLIDLINPYEFKEKKLDTACQILNIDCQVERSVFVIKIEDIFHFYKQVQDSYELLRLDEMKRSIIDVVMTVLDEKSIYTFLEVDTLFVLTPLKNINERDIAKKIHQNVERLGYRIQISIGSKNNGLNGYRTSYFQAAQNLRFMQIFNTNKKISYSDDWRLVKLLDSVPENSRAEFLQPYLDVFKQLREEDFNTIETWLDTELDIKKTSEKLHIHRNTLNYRLKKITNSMGLDYQVFFDTLILKLLVILRKLT